MFCLYVSLQKCMLLYVREFLIFTNGSVISLLPTILTFFIQHHGTCIVLVCRSIFYLFFQWWNPTNFQLSPTKNDTALNPLSGTYENFFGLCCQERNQWITGRVHMKLTECFQVTPQDGQYRPILTPVACESPMVTRLHAPLVLASFLIFAIL